MSGRTARGPRRQRHLPATAGVGGSLNHDCVAERHPHPLTRIGPAPYRKGPLPLQHGMVLEGRPESDIGMRGARRPEQKRKRPVSHDRSHTGNDFIEVTRGRSCLRPSSEAKINGERISCRAGKYAATVAYPRPTRFRARLTSAAIRVPEKRVEPRGFRLTVRAATGRRRCGRCRRRPRRRLRRYTSGPR